MPATAEGRRTAGRWAVAALAVGLYLWLADDGRHHWHEYRYLYSATYYSLADLAAGAFDATPPPAKPPATTGSWYWGQLGHEALLAGLVRAFGTGVSAHTAIVWSYALLMLLGVGGAVRLLRRLPLELDVTAIGLLLLYFPLTVYLGFKLLAEVPAFGWSIVACLLWLRALRASRRPVSAALSGAAGIALAASFLTMVYVPLIFVGLVLATSSVFRAAFGGHRRVLGTAGLTLLVAAAALSLVWLPLGLGVRDYAWMYLVYHREYGKPVTASTFLLGMSGSVLYLLVLASALSPRHVERRFLAVWAGGALLPVLLLSTNFLDARYAIVALVPLAGLATLGLEAMALQVRTLKAPLAPPVLRAWAAGVAVAVTAVTAPLMPFEIDTGDLSRLVRRIWQELPTAQVLVTSNYSDFHFLRFTYPDRPVFLVETPRDDAGRLVRDSAWEARRRVTYGEAFLPDLTALRPVAERGPLVYLGYRRLPTIDRLQRLSVRFGMTPVSRALEKMKPRDHLTESWMWGDPRFAFQPRSEVGQFVAYVVALRDPASADGAAATRR